jgi:hypothetical protein
VLGRSYIFSLNLDMLLIVWGPDADRRGKLLIYLAVEGSLLDACAHPCPALLCGKPRNRPFDQPQESGVACPRFEPTADCLRYALRADLF